MRTDASKSKRPVALVSYFGAKGRLGPAIAEELGPHRARYEPFCGGLSVTFACPPCGNEVVNDLNGDVINMAAVIASDKWEQLRDRLARTLCCDGLVLQSAHWLSSVMRRLPVGDKPGAIDPARVEKLHIDWAYHFAVASWLSRENGLIGARSPRTVSRTYTRSSSGPQRRLPRLVDGLPWMHERLRTVAIWSVDALSMIRRIRDEAGSAIYCDPPYLRATRASSYAIDVPTDPKLEEAWHADLAEALSRFKHTRVVVSYYDHPLLRRLYKRWSAKPLKARRIAGHADFGKSGSAAAPEILFINNGRAGAKS